VVFEQFYLGCLAQASYLIGSENVAAVVDPQRDVDLYLEAARAHGLSIQHIIETHLHADFVSGHAELAARTGARIYLGEGSGALFSHHEVRDGDEIAFGSCRLHFLHTPGHTPESVCVEVIDLERGSDPWAVLTGDTLFIGDVGRPDLSESHTPQELAGHLFESLHNKLLKLPDATEVYPAHGAGSMCGRNISSDRSSTIGRERRSNYALQPMSREQFVHMMTEHLPERPEYFERDVDLNRRGAVSLSNLPRLRPIQPRRALELQQAGSTILDTRANSEFCSGHIPGSINIGLGGQFAAWTASVLGLDRELILLADEEKAIEEARQRLARVGVERVAGFIEDGIGGWAAAQLPLAQTPQIPVQELAAERARNPQLSIVDVRRRAEWEHGHLDGARHAPLDRLRTELSQLDRGGEVAVYCKGGYRSTIACSLLQASGFKNVINVLGGFDAWAGAKLPIVKG